MVVDVRRVGALLEALEHQVAIVEWVDPALLGVASPCAGWTVRDVLNHSIGVTAKFASFAAGATDRPRTPHGDLLGADHRTAVRQIADRARAAWSAADLNRLCHLPFGTFSAESAAGINLFDVLAHTWDIASGAGLHLDVADELWNTGLEAAREVIGPNRDPAHYGNEIEVALTAPPWARFVGYLGRAAGPLP